MATKTKSTPQQVPSTFEAPKSRCMCGHTGDGPNSQHENALSDPDIPAGRGHRACKVKGCRCQRFTWSGFLPAFLRWRKKAGA